uniref:Uncharacterized protein n=1 Tax=Siphoviridae sp. ctkV91 TaxID=2827924 RepID=A0A8S5TDG8_9CAUD|nr:MAG TPA: hypothetical protein [Siphoviridae sp. ctkV91]
MRRLPCCCCFCRLCCWWWLPGVLYGTGLWLRKGIRSRRGPSLMVQPLKGWLPVLSRRVLRVGWSLRGFTVRVCVWMLCVLSGVFRVCRARPVSAARKGPLVLTAGMVLMVQLGWLALLVRRVPRV